MENLIIKFQITATSNKVNEDYTKYRPINHVITDEEYDYFYTDVHIMEQALKATD